MATDNEQLVLSISADVRQIQRQLKGLVGQTQRDTKAIEDAFGGIDKAASGAFSGVAANSNRAFSSAANSARNYERAMNSSSLQTANLAAQLNDIGVQLAGGQSPFLIALQQGTQITQALGPGAGLRGTVAALGGAFTSILNPVSLATIAIIALGGEAIQYFATLFSEGEKSEETLKQQAQLIQQVADRWGAAVPALREYADEIKRTQELASLDEGVKIINEKTLEDVQTAINESRIALASLVADMQQAEEPEVVKAFQSAFEQFAEAANDGSLKIEDVDRVQSAMAGAINSQGIPALSDFKRLLDDLSSSALGAAGSVQKVQEAAAGAKLTDANLPVLGTLPPLESVNGQLTGDTTAIQNARAEATQSQTQIEAAKNAKKSSRDNDSRSKAIGDIEREKAAIVDLIAQLEFEQSLIGMTSVERAQANALRRAGSAATDEQKAKIAQLVEQTYAERDALRANQEAMRELQEISRDVLQGVVSDLRAGKSGADILANALSNVADRLLNDVVNALTQVNGVGGGGGGFLSGLFNLFGGGGSKFPSSSGGLYSDGGYTGPGGKYQPAGVVHKGEYVFDQDAVRRAGGPGAMDALRRQIKGFADGGFVGDRPLSSMPFHSSKNSAASPSVTIPINIDATGADSAGLARVERQLAKLKAELPGTIIGTVKDAQGRRGI